MVQKQRILNRQQSFMKSWTRNVFNLNDRRVYIIYTFSYNNCKSKMSLFVLIFRKSSFSRDISHVFSSPSFLKIVRLIVTAFVKVFRYNVCSRMSDTAVNCIFDRLYNLCKCGSSKCWCSDNWSDDIIRQQMMGSCIYCVIWFSDKTVKL